MNLHFQRTSNIPHKELCANSNYRDFLEIQDYILCMVINLGFKLTSFSTSEVTDFINSKVVFIYCTGTASSLIYIKIQKLPLKFTACPYFQSCQQLRGDKFWFISHLCASQEISILLALYLSMTAANTNHLRSVKSSQQTSSISACVCITP